MPLGSRTAMVPAAAERIALKLRATRPSAQDLGRWSRARQGTTQRLPYRTRAPGSFKRMLGGGTCSANPLNDAHVALHSAL